MSTTVPTTDSVKALIRRAFADTPYPGDDDLVRSVGDEPDELVELFRGRNDWRVLTADFVDRAGAASPSALSFFSAGAFRSYLPAYLIADLDGRLVYTDPLFYLYHGLDEATRVQTVHVPGARCDHVVGSSAGSFGRLHTPGSRRHRGISSVESSR